MAELSAAPHSDPSQSDPAHSDNVWIPVCDMMAGLMMVFLFIAVLYAQHADKRQRSGRAMLEAWQSSERALYLALEQEFAADLPRWNAELEPQSLTIRFLAPEILFESGEARLRPHFEAILQDFFPRYIRLLADFAPDQIDEVRIEGHTSSRWGEMAGTPAFLHNMALSQARTRSVLAYGLNLPALEARRAWMMHHVSAHGLSSARVLTKKDGREDERRSRRVEFRIRTRSRATLSALMQEFAPAGGAPAGGAPAGEGAVSERDAASSRLPAAGLPTAGPPTAGLPSGQREARTARQNQPPTAGVSGR